MRFTTLHVVSHANRPYHGLSSHLDGWAKQSEITAFVWESDAK